MNTIDILTEAYRQWFEAEDALLHIGYMEFDHASLLKALAAAIDAALIEDQKTPVR